ncbi:MAG: hypothetical protein HY902_17835 [Deltaproteobacteria bacterium]|nr:hypothetical protein [Deltaproteobacteria bacterium]
MVCLALAVASTAVVPASWAADLPQAATPVEVASPATPVAASTDAALLAPLLVALAAAPDQRSAALLNLYLGGDPRAIGALRYIALHDQVLAVRQAACRELSRYADRRSIAALLDVAQGLENDSPNPEALTALSHHVLPGGAEALYMLAQNADADMAVRRDALEVLARDHPDILAARGVPSVGGSALVATLGAALFGGLALESVGGVAGTGGADLIGAITGGVLGGGAGYVFGRQVSNARQHYYMSAMTWGAAAGYLAARSLINRPYGQWGDRVSDEEVGLNRWSAGLTLLGELGGLVLAGYSADSLNLTSADVATADAIGLGTTIAVAGALGLMPEREDQRPGYAALLAGSLVGVGIGTAAARQLHFTAGDLTLIGYGAAEGLYYGAQLTDLVDPTRSSPSGGALGAGVAGLTATAVSQWIEPTAGNVWETAMFAQYGKLLGAGLTMVATDSNRSAQWAQLGGGALGLAGGAWLSQRTAYRGGDRAIIPIGSLLGLEHGALIGAIYDGQSSGQPSRQLLAPGLSLAGLALGGLGAAALGQYTDMTGWQATMGSTGAVWGAWFALWSRVLMNSESETGLATTVLISSDVGLAVSALAVSPLIGADPRILAGATFGGLAGGGLASLFTAMVTTNSDPIIRANLAGSATGLVAGGILAYFAYADSEPMDKKTADLGLPGWLKLPVRGVSSAPHFDTLGRPDGMVVLADLDIWSALSPYPTH